MLYNSELGFSKKLPERNSYVLTLAFQMAQTDNLTKLTIQIAHHWKTTIGKEKSRFLKLLEEYFFSILTSKLKTTRKKRQ